MTNPEPELDNRSVDRVLCLIACFFLALFVLVLVFCIACQGQTCPVLIDSGPNP